MQSTGNNQGPAFRLLDDRDNLADLSARVAPEDKAEFDSLGHTQQEAAFFRRRFILVRTGGLRDRVPRPPTVLGSVLVTGFRAELHRGCEATLVDEQSGKTLQVGHVPVRLFDYPVFVSIPIHQGLKWEAKELADGSYDRKLVFGLVFKQQSHIKWFNRGNVSVLTPNSFRQYFGVDPKT